MLSFIVDGETINKVRNKTIIGLKFKNRLS